MAHTNTFLDVELDNHFSPSLDVAALEAATEASNIGAAIVAIESIEVHTDRVTFIGTVPAAVADEAPSWTERPGQVRSFHTTWGAFFNPNERIGYLLMEQPINRTSYEAEGGLLKRIAVTLRRTYRTIQPLTLGPTFCISCRKKIPDRRLAALASARVCVSCQAKKEGTPQ